MGLFRWIGEILPKNRNGMWPVWLQLMVIPLIEAALARLVQACCGEEAAYEA